MNPTLTLLTDLLLVTMAMARLMVGCAAVSWRATRQAARQPKADLGGKWAVGYAVPSHQHLFTNAAVRDFLFSNVTHVVLLGATGFDSNGVVTAEAAELTNAVAVTHSKHRKISVE